MLMGTCIGTSVISSVLQELCNIKTLEMSLLRVLLAIFFPPLAVIDRGCGSVLIVFLLALCGWVPGVIGALVILNKN